jgi:squalene-hopene/tetraprenyl-beta-curcumene cyclase
MKNTTWLTCAALLLVLPGSALANDRDEAMYDRAITWLVSTQHPNGSFGQIPGEEPGELGITGLVLQGLATAPEPWRERYAENAQQAADYILANQQADGSFSHERSGLGTYRTGIAIMALTALDRDRYAEEVARAAEWLVQDQFSEDDGLDESDPHFGGFGYDQDGNVPDADLSNTHMAIAALRDAGIPEDDPVFQRALLFLSRCQNNSETNPAVSGLRPRDDGGFIYDPGLSRNKSGVIENEDGSFSVDSYASMTYAGLMALVYQGLGEDDPRVESALTWISRNYTLEENKGLGLRDEDPNAAQQGLYYYYHSFAKCLALRGESVVETVHGPRLWARDLLDALQARQKEPGFFQNEHSRWWERDPVLVTAYVINSMNYAWPHLED